MVGVGNMEKKILYKFMGQLILEREESRNSTQFT